MSTTTLLSVQRSQWFTQEWEIRRDGDHVLKLVIGETCVATAVLGMYGWSVLAGGSRPGDARMVTGRVDALAALSDIAERASITRSAWEDTLTAEPPTTN